MGQFDSPIEAFLSQPAEEPKNVAAEIAAEIAGRLQPLVSIGNALRKMFDSSGNGKSIIELGNVVKAELEYCWNWLEGHDKRLAGHDERLAEFGAKLVSSQFVDAAYAAVDEVRWTTRTEKIQRISKVLVRSFLPVTDEYAISDVATLVRDVSRLGEDDVFILQVLVEVHRDIIKQYPNLQDPNVFTERFPAVMKRIDEHRIHQDDFYAQCARLAGFGFAIEVLRNNQRMGLNDHCFRPTRRGVKVLEMISLH